MLITRTASENVFMIVLFVQPDLRRSGRSVGTFGGTCRVVPPHDLQAASISYTFQLPPSLPTETRSSRRVGVLATHGAR